MLESAGLSAASPRGLLSQNDGRFAAWLKPSPDTRRKATADPRLRSGGRAGSSTPRSPSASLRAGVAQDDSARVGGFERGFAARIVFQEDGGRFAAWLKPSPDTRRKATADPSTSLAWAASAGPSTPHSPSASLRVRVAQDDSAQVSGFERGFAARMSAPDGRRPDRPAPSGAVDSWTSNFLPPSLRDSARCCGISFPHAEAQG